MAAALLGYPRLLILDEPTNGLDPAGIQEMRELIKELPQRFGMTVVVSSHLLAEIDRWPTTSASSARASWSFRIRSQRCTAAASIIWRCAQRTISTPRRSWRERRLHVSEGEDGYLVLPLLNDDTTAALAELLVSAELGVLRLEERQKSLEDIFLDLTGKGASL